MSQSGKRISKSIKASIRAADATKVRITFGGDSMFTVEEFTSIFMGLLEEYTKGMVAANQPNGAEKVYDHWNRVFGIFLAKLLPEREIYSRDAAHAALKEAADATLGRPGEPDPADRLAAYMLCRDILVTEVGMTEESADVILNRRMGLLPPAPKASA